MLAQALESREALDAVMLMLDEHDFTTLQAKHLFSTLKTAYDNKEYMDFDTVYHKATETQDILFLNDVKEQYRGTTPLEQRIALLREQSAIRYAVHQIGEVAKHIKSGELDKPKAIAERLSSISKAVIVRTPETNNKSLSQLITDALNDAMKNNTDVVNSGIEPLDKITNGIRKGDYVVIAARTGVGKSALCLDFHLNTGLEKKWSMYCSTEMTRNEVILRSVAKASGVQLSVIRSTPDKINNQQMTDIIRAKNILEKSKLLFYDDLRTVNAIEAEYFRNKQRGINIRLIVVDYIQQLQSDVRKSSRQEELSAISLRLMKLAVEEQITVIVCAQLNRTSDMYSEPELSQIKDCGSIEQDATIVIGINKDKSDLSKTITHCHVMKHRNGVPDSCTLKFYGGTMRFFKV